MNPSRIERKNRFMDGLMRVNPVIRLKEDVEVCGPYTKFDLIEKGWIPENSRNFSIAPIISDFWSRTEWIRCRDGKSRPFEPGIFPLATRIPKRMGRSGDQSLPIDENDCEEVRIHRLKGYGNSIVPQMASEFIRAATESIREVSG